MRIPFNKITNIARVNNALLFANAITITAGISSCFNLTSLKSSIQNPKLIRSKDSGNERKLI